jgi:hypothetical protein
MTVVWIHYKVGVSSSHSMRLTKVESDPENNPSQAGDVSSSELNNPGH